MLGQEGIPSPSPVEWWGVPRELSHSTQGQFPCVNPSPPLNPFPSPLVPAPTQDSSPLRFDYELPSDSRKAAASDCAVIVDLDSTWVAPEAFASSIICGTKALV